MNFLCVLETHCSSRIYLSNFHIDFERSNEFDEKILKIHLKVTQNVWKNHGKMAFSFE